MEQAISRGPFTAEVWVQSQVSQCEIYGGRSTTGSGFFSEYFDFTLSFETLHNLTITDARLTISLNSVVK
jgi:hypothetical protein